MSQGVTSKSNGVEDFDAVVEAVVVAEEIPAALEAVEVALELVSTDCLRRVSRLQSVDVVDGVRLDE